MGTNVHEAAGGALVAGIATGHLDLNVIIGTFAAVVFVTLVRPLLARLLAAPAPKDDDAAKR